MFLWIRWFENSRVFYFKKTNIPTRLTIKLPKSSAQKSQPESLAGLLKTWMREANASDPYITAARYIAGITQAITESRGHQTRTWLSVQDETRRRVLSAGRNNLLVRYKHVFPKNYLRHSYVYEALYIAFFYKDLRFFVTLLQRLFKDVNFFKHRFLIYYLRAVFNNFGIAQAQLGGVRGLFVKFRGKISQAGNSRKKRFMIGCGQISTGHSAHYEIEKFQIKTFTGAIGCTIILAFN